MAKFIGLILQVIEERTNANMNNEEKQKREGRGKAFLDLLLELETEGRLNRGQIQEQMDTFLFAGLFTRNILV
jgi:cytochrome P450